KAINHYTNFIKQFRHTALPHEIIQANVNAGRAYLNLGSDNKNDKAKEAALTANKAKAAPYFEAALKEWQESKDQFGSLPVPDDQKERYMAFAKIGAAESLFHLADRDFDKFKAIPFAVFKTKITGAKGSLEKKKQMQEKFTQWMQQDFVKWLGEKSKALETAQKSYEGISELKVPQWDIASATRIGDMYLSLVNDFRDAPVPPV